MVIVRLTGGLGNQMFQYAAGKRLAELRDTDLKLDISGLEKDKLRSYALGPFNIQEQFASQKEIAALKVPRNNIIKVLVTRCLNRSLNSITHINEKFFHFDPEVLTLSGNVYLNGYWESQKYFSDIDTLIRRQFTIKTPQTGKNLEIMERISSCMSVSIHVRRGDYISNPLAKEILGTCSLDYYVRSVEKLEENINKFECFVFTDDPEWVKEKFKLPCHFEVIDHNDPKSAHEDLRLMSQCKHHVIANSTFSWWAAWLAPFKNKVVIAPNRWFQDPSIVTDDLIPQGWIRIS